MKKKFISVIPEHIKKRYRGKFTDRDFLYFILSGVITVEWSSGDIEFLDRLARVWRRTGFAKRVMMGFPYKVRKEIIETAPYSRIESYIYKCLKRQILEERRVDYKRLMEEVERYYNRLSGGKGIDEGERRRIKEAVSGRIKFDVLGKIGSIERGLNLKKNRKEVQDFQDQDIQEKE